ncbi:MAG TPA: glycosyl hydrolase, partial [Burkholderiales bacterium]|nr:glycosyl hydrolase [Burkholderiales bacterium]
GAFDGRPILARTTLEGGATDRVALPPLAKDAVAYIAQNPLRRDELAIATFRRSVFLSADRGRTWRQIAAEEKGR